MKGENSKRPIGVFDSGVGGLTVVREIKKALPEEDIVYLGDTARVPYGTKSQKTIKKFAVEDVMFLLKHKVKLIVIACNTVSSVALNFLKETFPEIPIFGVVEPGVKEALRVTKSGNIGVIGTIATIKSGAHEKALLNAKEDLKVYTKPCPLFVPLAEEGITQGKIANDVISLYLHDLKGKIDALILGCTHYPLLKKAIKGFMGSDVTLVDPAVEIAKTVKTFLEKNNLLNKAGGELSIHLTDVPPHYKELIERFLGQKVNHIFQVELTGCEGGIKL